jgi:hypothetical protein
MWTADKENLGQAKWTSDAVSFSINARGGSHGVQVIGEDGSEHFRFDAIEGKELSAVTEQYVRGDELHLLMPQGDNEFGVKLTFEPVESSESKNFILQATVSIQTSLLDTHPKLDVAAPAETTQAIGDAGAAGSPPVSVAKQGGNCVAVILGGHDSPFTTNNTTDTEISLRLFGDFLEKGVIRKARPWFVFASDETALSSESLLALADELSNSPLPLTP